MNRYLDMVDNPTHIKKLTVEQLQSLASEIRHELITVLSRNGGHLGPNLGVVELTLALHHIFSTPKDKFVWDVSHQSYVHKLLTGRKSRFNTIRTTDGLCGFSLRTESEHDCYGAAHAGTALSAALGIAAARDQRGSDENVVAIFGDAALTNGISFEALNNISHTTKRFIGVLNDNEWSIAKNVGAIASYLNKLITHPRYNRLQRDFIRLIRRIPKGEIALMLAHKAEEGFKGAVTDFTLEQSVENMDADGRGGFGSSLIFEEMGLRYLGPIDGHDLPALLNCLEFAKNYDRPIVLHVLTKKGKGHDVALQDLPVIFCMDRAGLSANDGPTHHGVFDISYLRSIPNIIVMAPKDEDELVDMMFTATHERHATFIRYPRGAAEGVPIKEQPK